MQPRLEVAEEAAAVPADVEEVRKPKVDPVMVLPVTEVLAEAHNALGGISIVTGGLGRSRISVTVSKTGCDFERCQKTP